MALPTPNFINRNPDQIVREMIADYEQRVGKKLQPAQVERLLINSLAYRELLLRNQVQEAALQNLVSFAVAPMLDYLGDLLGVARLPASSAGTTLQFTLIEGHADLTIPAGLRVATTDGRAVFITAQDVFVAEEDTTATVDADCDTVGRIGNGYDTGTVTTILDPQPYLVSATNTTVTGGGADDETDEELRERIKLAPSAFSTAGSRGAYKFHAKSAHPSIVDVEVTSPIPGTVNIYPLVDGGVETPSEVLSAVFVACSAEKVRPLTDTVEVITPTKIDYAIVVDLTLYSGADSDSTVAVATAQLTDFVNAKKNLLGGDIIITQIVERSLIQGRVYDVAVTSPSSDLIIDGSQFGNCTSITVNVTGYNNG